MTAEYSEADLSVSPAERVNFFGLAARCRSPAPLPRKLFVSRLSRSQANPNYRVLQNEAALITALEALGFTTVEPELLPVAGQIGLFAATEQILFLGGSGIFNAAFCAPDRSVITIESSATYVGTHAAFFASLGLRHGIIFGQEDETDTSTHHKRSTLDVAHAMPIIEEFFREA
jgi:capsular polysaccharide biosynthesis protein